jgi:cation diffusion facilitator CzcD-associated flavoprotein CzcO
MPDVDIVIVGGGPAGLSTAGALKSIGLEAVVLDKDDRIGGSWARRYERLHLHTVRAFSGLAHFPIPRHFPKYISKDLYAQYLQDYARHFNLNYNLNSLVRKVRAADDGDTHNLIVETEGETWHSRVVVVATGQFCAPVLPNWSGLDEYQGRVIHSFRYKTGRDYAGQRVLVIGVGNSGAEIAADLAEQGASFVAISIRTPPPVVPRDLLGTPVQVFGILMSLLPPRLADQIGYTLARIAMGDLTRYGLRRPAWLPFTAKRIPIIDVGFIKEVKKGEVRVRPNIARFTRTGVVYEDGQEEGFDVVIAATGFTTGLDQLLDVSGMLDTKGLPMFPQGQPTAKSGLFFMGYVESQRGHLYEANLASRQLAKIVKKYLSSS